jgi:hypoxanthine phosphoribosyltransferase
VKEKPAVLFTEDEIQKRVRGLGAEIGRVFAGRAPCVVGLMKGCLVFMADLIRAIPLDVSCHFLRVRSLREDGAAAKMDIVYTSEVPYEGQDILLLDDIIDTGITLQFLLDHIQERRPRALRVCALIDKPGDRKIDVHPDWAAFTIPEPTKGFLVGYGLDHDEHFRGLPYIGTIARPGSSGEGRRSTLS